MTMSLIIGCGTVLPTVPHKKRMPSYLLFNITMISGLIDLNLNYSPYLCLYPPGSSVKSKPTP